MLILIAVFLAVAVALVIALPFLRPAWPKDEILDEGSLDVDIKRRWDAVVAGLRNTELERAIGNLTHDDHRSILRQYILEAAGLMKAMSLDGDQEQALLADLGRDVREVRTRLLGPDGPQYSPTCPHCMAVVEIRGQRCAACGQPLQVLDSDPDLTERRS